MKIDVNNGKNGDRWNAREFIKKRTRKLRRVMSKKLSKENEK